MPINIRPPFKVVLTIPEETKIDSDRINLRRLRDVVAGKDKTYSRSRAMALLAASDFPNKHRDFEALLENENESSEIRYLAAITLGKIGTPGSLEILVKNSQVLEERVLSGIMTALGRIGDKSALAVVEKVKGYATGMAAARAKFAVTLISHRLGVNSQELSIPEDKDYINLPPYAFQPLQITPTSRNEAELCLRSLAKEPFGIDFSEEAIYKGRIGRCVWTVLFNREFTYNDSVRKIVKRKAFLGAIATRSEHNWLYFPTFLILSSPAKEKDTIDVLIHRLNGDIMFGGKAYVKGKRAEFAIRSLSRPGAIPIEITGSLIGGRLEVKQASVSWMLQGKRHPKKEPRLSKGEQKLD
jgi:hypothetical protein